VKAFDEKGRRWFARTNVEMVVGWAEEPEFQRFLRLPLTGWERGYYGTEEQILQQMAERRALNERLRAMIPARLTYLRALLRADDHVRVGSVASCFSCGDADCTICDGGSCLVGDVR
jgi:hypothetical protein